MEQIERIGYYEKLLNEAETVLKQYDAALEAYIGIQKKISELDKYYSSEEWKKDFEASEKGKLPKDLLCGVLSEDGIDHMLSDNLELYARTRMIEQEVMKK